ncbi:MAG: hypothetical protein R6V40_04115 [Candidatus Moraniibacteriota bacterium]
MEKQHLATITILVKDRQNNSVEVNRLLTDHGHLILSRLGTNLEKRCIEHCSALIVVTIEASIKEIKNLTEKIDSLYGIVAKHSIVTN